MRLVPDVHHIQLDRLGNKQKDACLSSLDLLLQKNSKLLPSPNCIPRHYLKLLQIKKEYQISHQRGRWMRKFSCLRDKCYLFQIKFQSTTKSLLKHTQN